LLLLSIYFCLHEMLFLFFLYLPLLIGSEPQRVINIFFGPNIFVAFFHAPRTRRALAIMFGNFCNLWGLLRWHPTIYDGREYVS